jgi:lipid-binding SYLF domain-containing protein
VKLQELSGGLQLGIQVSEIIMLVKNPEFIKNLETADAQFGADVNATAGPDGTNMALDANPDFEAEIYTYQKSEGLFGGASLAGGALIFSWKLNQAEYGEMPRWIRSLV